MLNECFGSVGTVDDGATPVTTRGVPDSASIDSLDLSPVQVLSAIRELKDVDSLWAG